MRRVFHWEICLICACILMWGSGCEDIINNPINPELPGVSSEVGNQAPDFSLPNELNDTVALSDYRGKNNIVLIFHTGST